MLALLAIGEGGGVDLTDPLTYIIGYGPLGVFVALFILGKIHPQNHVDNLMEQIRRKDDVIDGKDKLIQELQDGVIHDAMPALEKSTEAIKKMSETGKTIRLGIDDLKASVNNLFNLIVSWIGGRRDDG